MKTFQITFNAKKLGSIDKRSGHIKTVEASDKHQARRLPYKEYEHVTIINIEEISE